MVSAQALALVPDCARFQTETPGLDCVLEAFLGFARFILSITGSVALLIFVLAGFMYLVNAHNADEAKKATIYIKNAAIGLAIILCSGIGVNYLQKTLRGVDVSDQACTSIGNGYACIENAEGIRCKQGLCLGNAKASIQCCQPNKEPFISEKCKESKGDDHVCIDTKNAEAGTCSKGFCPGAANIQCCIEKKGPATPTVAAKTISCMDAGTHTFLGCQDLASCTEAGGLCDTSGVQTGDCIQLSNDIRCTQSLSTNLIYGCFDLNDPSPRPLLGCVEVPIRSACNVACQTNNRSLDTCGFDVANSPPDQECINPATTPTTSNCACTCNLKSGQSELAGQAKNQNDCLNLCQGLNGISNVNSASCQ
jgi:hypothetical protein